MNRAEFDVILERYYLDLIGWCKKLTQNEEECMDLAHDTIVKAIEGCADFTPDNPKAWLFTIAKNSMINDIKKNRHIVLCDQDDQEQLEGGVIHPPLCGEADRYATAYAAAIESLSPAMMDVFLLREQGMTTPQIAREIGIPLGTVKSRLFNASRRIFAFLSDREE